MTLLFDGSFKITDHRTNSTCPSGAFGSVWEQSLLPQPDSGVPVYANTLPGGRTGVAVKFKIGPGPAYDCATNQHNLVQTFKQGNLIGTEIWYGWSQMLEASWNIYTPMNRIGFGSGDGSSTYAAAGIKIAQSVAGILHLYVGRIDYRMEGVHMIPGVWEDWMYHVKWKTDSTGFFEVYKNGNLVYSGYNVATVPPGVTYYFHRLGLYRSSASSTDTKIAYMMNPKIGTTRADVSDGSPPPTCPSASLNMVI